MNKNKGLSLTVKCEVKYTLAEAI